MIRRRTPIARKRKGTAAQLQRAADADWKQLVLERDERCCVRCGAGRYLQAHHIRSRRFKSTRWELANGLTLCRGCHFWVHNHLEADETVAFYEGLGCDYAALKVQSLVRAKGMDYAAVVVALRSALHGTAADTERGE